MKKIKVKILNEACGDVHQPTMQVMHVPEIGIHPDDEPCGCPDMAHNHGDHEGSMSRTQLMHMKNYAEELMQMISDHDDLPEWVELKITLANDYIAKVKHYLEGEIHREQGKL
tara:strand:- start:31 stop:369 length:339 start_codon:yes stop_codon:yes gene_type:complete